MQALGNVFCFSDSAAEQIRRGDQSWSHVYAALQPGSTYSVQQKDINTKRLDE